MKAEIRHTDTVGSILWLALAVGVFLVSEDLPVGRGETGPAFYPRVIAVLIGGFALLQLGRSIYESESTAHTIRSDRVTTVGAVAVLVAVYVLSLPWLGFVIATTAFLVVCMVFSGARSFLRISTSAIGVSLLLYYLFVVLLRVPLPESPFVPVRTILPGLIHVGHGVLY